MMYRRILWHIIKNNRVHIVKNELFIQCRLRLNVLQMQCKYYCEHKKTSENETKALKVVNAFEDIEDKSKTTYLEMIKIFINRDEIHRRGHVEFINSALNNMETFGVHKDLEVYKAILDVFPKGKLVARNFIQTEFMHYPKQLNCATQLLEQMEDNAIIPDKEMADMLKSIFGDYCIPLRKLWRMMYWMPKFKNLSPWPVQSPAPTDPFELAKMAIKRITEPDLQTKISIYQTKDITDAIDDTWIVSAQSDTQKNLLEQHNKTEPIFVEGSFRVWLRDRCVSYFLLRVNNLHPFVDKPPDTDDVSHLQVPFLNTLPQQRDDIIKLPSIHEQDEGIIMSACATGTSSKDSLLSWIRHLEKENPNLSNCSIVFKLRAPEVRISVVDSDRKKINDS